MTDVDQAAVRDMLVRMDAEKRARSERPTKGVLLPSNTLRLPTLEQGDLIVTNHDGAWAPTRLRMDIELARDLLVLHVQGGQTKPFGRPAFTWDSRCSHLLGIESWEDAVGWLQPEVQLCMRVQNVSAKVLFVSCVWEAKVEIVGAL